MNLSCACGQEFSLEDSKVPEGLFKVRCPKCGKIITAQRSDLPQEESPGPSVPPVIEAYVKQEIAALKRELRQLMEGSKRERHERFPGMEESFMKEPDEKKALVCEDDFVTAESIANTLRSLGYAVENVQNAGDALKKLEVETYDLVTVDLSFPDDREGGRKIIGRLNGKRPFQRRRTFLVLISANSKSLDSNAAFFHGVNLTVNQAELNQLEAYIREGQKHFAQMYHAFQRLILEKEESVAR